MTNPMVLSAAIISAIANPAGVAGGIRWPRSAASAIGAFGARKLSARQVPRERNRLIRMWSLASRVQIERDRRTVAPGRSEISDACTVTTATEPELVCFLVHHRVRFGRQHGELRRIGSIRPPVVVGGCLQIG
jgi:hypothetical protein